MNDIVVRKVEDKADYKVFFEFPWRHYADDNFWVPPLKSVRKHLIDREKDASWEYMDGEYFVAWRGEEPVGIIAAFINHHHNEKWNENTGWFGSFEFQDDPVVAQKLLAAAEEYVRSKGCDAIRGPATFNLHSEVGILMDNYDQSPILMLPYNYPYYPSHIESAGYSKLKDLLTWRSTQEHFASVEDEMEKFGKVQKMAERVMKRRNITMRRGNKQNTREDFQIIYELYNTAWNDNWGFVPLTERELDSMINDLQQIYDPEMSTYVFVDGDPAGFFVAVPDMNQAFKLADPKPGVPEIWSLLKILWHWKIRPKIDTVRLPLGGIKPEYRQSTGVVLVLGAAILSMFRDANWQTYDGGWILEDNDPMNELVSNFNAVHGCRYRIYHKVLIS
jgi:hypothetical protein